MLELSLTRTIPAPRSRVFDAWLNPEMLARFMTPGPQMTVPEANTDPQVGGRYLIVMQAGERSIPHQGEYKAIERPDRLVFTWTSPFTTQDHLVTLTFEEAEGDQTRLTLHHQGFSDETSRSNHEGGWGQILEVLQGVMRG